ncbi:hypothetical protein SAMN05216241_11419 [Limimonas halophila]|uniref:Membrane-associated oxidoreductase n=1 Tax=Limimonas halophila TaxID=1082479 RepID=A0A1G7UFJ5_9PROT|nr:hypothetical protein [Limimonas halophila]SDG46263.1 hypothetical protein SAMN05216241_11419 [Limimonas halophila]
MTQAARPAGRTLKEFKDQDTENGLLPAEDDLHAAARQGETCVLDEHEKPPIRASFIRFLALGGDEKAPVHEKGVDLENATIEGQLDLSRCKNVLPLYLDNCTLSSDAPITAQDAHLSLLSLQGSTVPGGIDADRANVEGSVLLRNGARIKGEIRFSGAQIHGDFDASGSTLTKADGDALFCDRARIGGTVFLSENANITGTVNFRGARIEGDLDAHNSTLTAKHSIALVTEHAVIEGKALLSNGFKSDGTIHFRGATVRRDLDLTDSVIKQPRGSAFDLRDIRVEGTLHLDSVRDDSKVPGRIDGHIDLRGAHVAYFADRLADTEPENAPGVIGLDQFRYERFVGNSTLNVDARLRWLRFQPAHHQRGTAGSPDGRAELSRFRPQPYDQLADVYRAIGHHRDYHRVLREKHTRALRDDVGISPDMDADARVRTWVARISSWQRLAPLKWLFVEQLIGYGHRVWPLFAVFFALFGLSFVVFWAASGAGLMVPTDGDILVHAAWEGACASDWPDCDLPILKDYPDFSAFFYTLDILLPIVGLEQQAMWTPNWVWLNVLKWINILYGWFTGLMLVAIVSGVVQRA